MRKLIALTLALVLAMTALCGCNILEMGKAPTLPKLSYDESTLTGKVEFVNGRTCRISVLEGDGPPPRARGDTRARTTRWSR